MIYAFLPVLHSSLYKFNKEIECKTGSTLIRTLLLNWKKTPMKQLKKGKVNFSIMAVLFRKNDKRELV